MEHPNIEEQVMKVRKLTMSCTAIAALVSAPPIHAASPHEEIRNKLVALEIVGRDANGRDVSSFGSGFLIHEGGYVLTAAHLYEDLIKRGAEETTLKTTAHVADFSSFPVEAHLVD